MEIDHVSFFRISVGNDCSEIHKEVIDFLQFQEKALTKLVKVESASSRSRSDASKLATD